MANGECHVGAAHSAQITELERRMGHLEQCSDETVKAVSQLRQNLAVRKARLDGWGTVIVAVVAAVASLIPTLVAHFAR